MRLASALVALPLLVLIAAPAVSQDRGQGRGRGGDPWERLSRYDADGDGKVTRAEFTGPARVFQRFDTDGDGTVTKEEVASRSGGARGTRGGAAGGDLTWIFKLLDRDRDDVLEGEDVKALTRAADTDGDGRLSRSEFLAFVKTKSSPSPGGTAPEEGELAPAFTLRKLRGEGTLSLRELITRKRPVVIAFGSLT